MKLTKSKLKQLIKEEYKGRMYLRRVTAETPEFLKRRERILQTIKELETWLDAIDCRRGHVRGLSKRPPGIGMAYQQPNWKKMLRELERKVRTMCLPCEEEVCIK